MEKRIVCMILILAGIMTGCQTEEEKGQDISESYMASAGVCISDTCSVYAGEDKLLHYYDAKQKQDIILCNKADCKHEKYDEQSNPDPTCDAALNDKLSALCTPILSGEYIYLVGIENLKQGVVYREKRDGSDRKRLYTLDYQINVYDDAYVKDGIAYVVAHVPLVREDKLGGSGSNSSYSVLLKLNLETGECKQITQIIKKDTQSITFLGVNDSTIFYDYSYLAKDEKDKDKSTASSNSIIFSYNFVTGENKQLFDSKELAKYKVVGVSNDSLCVMDNKNCDAYEISFQTKEAKKIYTPPDKEIIYFVFQGKWIVERIIKEQTYYLQSSLKPLNKVSAVVKVMGKYIEFIDISGKRCVMSADDFWKQNDNNLFERAG